MVKDTEYLNEIKAREELEQRGYKRVKCRACGGEGALYQTVSNVIAGARPCPCCNGQGYNWEAPITK